MADPASHSIRVLVVDDQPAARFGLQTFFLAFSDLDLVGSASSGEEAVRLCEQLAPDVVLMDLVMPGMDGPTATRIIRARWPHIRVVGLTSFAEPSLLDEALQAGAVRCLLKGLPADELANVIRSVYRNGAHK